MKLKTSLLALSLATISGFSNAANYSYVEVGFGASQWHSFDKDNNENLSDLSLGGAGKILVASRLNRSDNSWFELGYNYNRGISFQDYSQKSQTLLAGLKLTTNPKAATSAYMKFGVARTETKHDSAGSPTDADYINHGYGGLGMSFRLDTKQAISLEAQRFVEKGTSTGLNTIFITFKHSI